MHKTLFQYQIAGCHTKDAALTNAKNTKKKVGGQHGNLSGALIKQRNHKDL